MTAASVRRPGATILIALALVMFFLALASRLVTEVGYSAYFGRDDPRVDRVVAFQRELQIGLQLLVVFGCQESPKCQRIDEPRVLSVGDGRLRLQPRPPALLHDGFPRLR